MNDPAPAPRSKTTWVFAIVVIGLIVVAIFSSMDQSPTEALVAERTHVARPLSVDPTKKSDLSTLSESGGDLADQSRQPASTTENQERIDGSNQSVSSELDPDEVVLDPEKQKHIWDVEHKTFELETHFGKSFRAALQARDKTKITPFFVDDAAAAIIPAAAGNRHQVASIVEELGKSGVRKADVQELANNLIQSVSSLDRIDGTRFRVLKLNTDDGKNWTSQVLLELKGITSNGQRLIVESFHKLRLRFESDEDIKDGKIVAHWEDELRSSRLAESALMEEITKSAGLSNLVLPDNWDLDPSNAKQYWFQIAVEDFNHDGYPDIAVATYGGTPYLLQSNEGKTFDDVTEQMNLKSWVDQYSRGRLYSLATWIDYDDDGWSDLLLGNRLYRNLEGKSFNDVTELSGLRLGYDPMGAVVADYDCDGLLDLYVLYQDKKRILPSSKPEPWVGDTKSGVENQLWHNEGGRFRNATIESRAGGGPRRSFAAVWHHMNEDRFPDLYIANDFGQNIHLRNLGNGKFEDISKSVGTADFSTSMGACSGDLDNDGRPEIYVANMYSKMGRRIIQNVCDEDYPAGIYEQIQGSCAGNRLYTLQDDSDTFKEISEQIGVNDVGWAYAPVMADFDSNGFLDIYATTGFMSFKRGRPDG